MLFLQWFSALDSKVGVFENYLKVLPPFNGAFYLKEYFSKIDGGPSIFVISTFKCLGFFVTLIIKSVLI